MINLIRIIVLLNIFSFFACGLFLGKALPHTRKDKISPLVAMALLGSRSNSIGANAANPQGTNSTNTSPSNLTYSTTSLQLYLNTVMTTLVPTSIASITNCSSSPSLPIGLNLDPTTCAISGTPTATSALTAYTITASNSTGSMTAKMDITVNPIWIQEAYIKAPNADINDGFGQRLSIYENTIAVGVRNEDSNQTTITNGTTASSDNSFVNSGAVYVFKRNGTIWEQEAYIKPANADAGDTFGQDVAIYSDTIVTSAIFEDSNQTTISNGTIASLDNGAIDSGAVYVYKRTGSTWNQEAYIKAPNAEAGDNFGVYIAICEDTIAVSAYQEDSNQTTITNGISASSDNSLLNSGAVYIFKRTGTIWAQEAYIKPSNADANDWFGYLPFSLSTDTLAIGAYNEDSNQTTITNGSIASANNSSVNSGAVYVFRRTGATWVQEAYIKAANADANDQFGATSLSGDTLAVGTGSEDSNQVIITNGSTASSDNSLANSGAVYIYKRTGTTWAQEAYIKPSNAGSNDNFGLPSLSSDTLLVTAWTEDSNQTTITHGATASADNSAADSGAAYIYQRIGTIWIQEAYIKAANADAGDRFGSYASIYADTIAIGAQGEDSNQTTITNGPTASADNSLSYSGAVYVFRRKYQ